MKRLLLALAAALAATSLLTSCHGGGHPFSDSFDGTTLDTGKWMRDWYTLDTNDPSDPPNSAMTSCWAPSNVSVSGGQLHLALDDTDCTTSTKTYAYRGSGIVQHGNIAFDPPMRFECRVRFPELFGAYINWPACWVTTSDVGVPCQRWPEGGEFDIAEGLGNTSLEAVTHAANFCGGPDVATAQTLSTSNDGQFHTYRVDLDQGTTSCSSGFTAVKIQYARDGVTQPSYERCMNVGSGWDFVLQHSTGEPGGTSVAPATVDVDYVTVTDGH